MQYTTTTHAIDGSDHLQEPALQYARKDFPIIRDSVTVGEALNIIRHDGVGERIIYFYIINAGGKLTGIIPTRRLLTSMPDRAVADIMITDVIKIPDSATVRDACEMFVKHKLYAFPIVDNHNQIRGVIDIGFFSEESISVSERHKIADVFELIGFGMAQLQGRSAFGVLRYRLPWLLMMIASGLICAAIANTYETTLSQNVILVLFLVLVLGLSQSVSAQSMTVALQNLHFGSPSWRSYGNWLKNEITTSLLIGIVCGALAGLVAALWDTPLLGFTIGGSVLASMLIGSATGVTIPTLIYATHEHSKIATGPVTHAVTYITTLLLYLVSARLFLGD
jgi:magnesium transporter